MSFVVGIEITGDCEAFQKEKKHGEVSIPRRRSNPHPFSFTGGAPCRKPSAGLNRATRDGVLLYNPLSFLLLYIYI